MSEAPSGDDGPPGPKADKSGVAEKYDRGASTYAERTHADPDAVARRQAELVLGWGTPVKPGASVLELGCADGLVTAELARRGLLATAVDLSPKMIETARRRLSREGLDAEFVVGDACEVRGLSGDDKVFDVTLAMMRTFFHYVDHPARTLAEMKEKTRVKILVDVNPRASSIRTAVEMVRKAGFVQVTWRGFFVPQSFKVPAWVHKALEQGERVPGLNRAVASVKFHAVVKGEIR
ncbi:MAG: class I SAM-dependent methyltransferase [Actinomycetota bacterium]